MVSYRNTENKFEVIDRISRPVDTSRYESRSNSLPRPLGFSNLNITLKIDDRLTNVSSELKIEFLLLLYSSSLSFSLFLSFSVIPIYLSTNGCATTQVNDDG